ncbi:SDR family NAD(P)-dependent oxidoreductase [Phyllobacterium leguminum]|uniref:NAD(P)-dependent dehydrogenase (Short-subunit alcohol dehydrogenase family) n=1 Tax=Phyllobacterium leguminum TaxID=314237 RepID=A0A318T6Q9_9HYPH|nr:glucose 1-dehydrogenase [Phyllobacterium leguminum]PYE88707.1 NAD(P)-dependent dehydrogenase (short-subunit alcohol dehydrogenase family) [Phyllobacterium leguminum]
MGKLDGKIAVITGASTGMGLATAKLFVREGAEVIITGRDQAALDAAVLDIGKGAEAIRGDISSLADLDALRAHVEARHGRLDILFANAGVGKPGLFEEVSDEDFDFTVGINFKGTFFTVQKLISLMPAGGSIILNTSIQGVRGTAGLSVYSATKAALRSLARSLTAEYGPKGIRINALAPGFIDTDIMRRNGLSEEMIREMKTQSTAHTPLGRIGTGHDIAKTALFLATDESEFITGVELTVDGGWAQV